MQCGVGRYFMPAAHLLTDTEKSSVPYKTPLKNRRERTILGVFVKLGVRRLILISQILIIYLPGNISRPGALGYQFLTSHLQHYSGSPRITPARPELPWLTQGQQLIQDHLKPCTASQAWPPPQAHHLKPCAQKWQTAAAAARAARANATFRPRVAP